MIRYSKTANWSLPLQSLLSYHQHSLSQEELYSLVEKSTSEAINIDDLDKLLHPFNLKANWQKYTWKNLQYCELPAMIVLKDGKAVTLVALHSKFAIIAMVTDNQVREQQISIDSLKKDFSGHVLHLDYQIESIGAGNRIRLSEWIDRKSLRMTMLEVILASLMINLFQIALPLYTMNVYDKVIPNQAEETLWVLFSGIVVILALDYLFRLVRGIVLENLSERIGEAIEIRFLRKALTTSIDAREDVGSETDTLHEINSFRANFFGKTLVEIIEFPFFLIFFLILYAISETIALIPLFAGLVIVSVNLIHHFPLKSLGRNLFSIRKQKESFLVQVISGRDSLRLSNAMPKFLHQWQSTVRKSLSLGRATSLWFNSMGSFTPIVVQGVSVMVVLLGSYEVFQGTLTVGGMVAATILSARAILPILNFSNAITRLISSRHQVKAWRKALNRQTDFDVNENLLNKGRLKGNLILKNVRFKYTNAPQWIIDGVSFHVRPGEKLAIIGPSGSGKTSLLNLISGLTQANEGSIQMDSYDVNDIHPYEMHRSLSFMPQNPAFFSGTLRDNIQLGNQVDHQRLEMLVNNFGLTDMVGQESIGASLSHQITENGSNLSGGQRQLIALLRCLYVDACTYVLDEPTAGMDGQLETLVIKYMQTANE